MCPGAPAFFVLMALVVILGPWMIQWRKGQPSATKSCEQRQAEREEKQQVRQDADLAVAKADAERGWDLACG